MKRNLWLLTAGLAAMALCACGQPQKQDQSQAQTAGGPISAQEAWIQETAVQESADPVILTLASGQKSLVSETGAVNANGGEEEAGEEKILIAYFTWAENVSDTAKVDGASSASVLMPGNVGQMAAWIQEETGGDLFSIQTEEVYPSDYNQCLERAMDEKAENARPALKGTVDGIETYDIVFLGFPDWCYTTPMAVCSFLEEYDLTGKRVVMFCSHGTGGLASCVKDITHMLPDSDIESEVLGVYRDDVPECQETIKKWLDEIGL